MGIASLKYQIGQTGVARPPAIFGADGAII